MGRNRSSWTASRISSCVTCRTAPAEGSPAPPPWLGAAARAREVGGEGRPPAGTGPGLSFASGAAAASPPPPPGRSTLPRGPASVGPAEAPARPSGKGSTISASASAAPNRVAPAAKRRAPTDSLLTPDRSMIPAPFILPQGRPNRFVARGDGTRSSGGAKPSTMTWKRTTPVGVAR